MCFNKNTDSQTPTPETGFIIARDGLRIWISNKLPGEAVAAFPQTVH